MVKHVVMWRLKDQADGQSKEENARRMKEKLESMIGKVDALSSLQVGINVNESPAAFDVVLITEHPDAEHLEQYQVNPLHKEVAAFVSGLAAERAVVDFTF